MGKGEVRVDPAVLQAAANVCRELKDATARAVSDVEPETVAADKAISGWYSQKALQALTSWWQDDLNKLGKRLDQTATALDECAQDYMTTDHALADHFYDAERPE